MSNWPKVFEFEANEGNSFLDAGRHAWSRMTISQSGRVDLQLRFENRVALVGYCFKSSYFFRDQDGNIVLRWDFPQTCVDGTSVPWGSPKREINTDFSIPKEIQDKTNDVVIVHGPGGKDTMELLSGNIQKSVGIFKLIFG